MALKRSVSLEAYRGGPLAPYLAASPALEIGLNDSAIAAQEAGLADQSGYAVVFAGYRLQDLEDYRGALQAWFGRVRMGGSLVVVAPHAFLYERQNALPSRWNPFQRRLYTPASLMLEIEEALPPNSYRILHLGDEDAGYDYAQQPDIHPGGRHDVVVALQKITPPSWKLSGRVGKDQPKQGAPDFSFEPAQTRVESAKPQARQRILVLKLDHVGDFIMGVPALQKVRDAFPDAEMTLVVGSWNHAMAIALGLFDHVDVFDGFPRNSGEEKDDIRGAVSEFEKRVTGEYDLAIDLRTDHDTRVLLESVKARVKAGIGTKAQFGFLDIFLPIDRSRHTEQAWEVQIPAKDFPSQSYCRRNDYQILCEAQSLAPHGGAIFWGPYRRLSPGQYQFEPFLDIDWTVPGVLRYDIGINTKGILDRTIADGIIGRVDFMNVHEDADFEFRIWTVDDQPIPRIQFYGGRLIKQGSSSVLHQSEYLLLLIELVTMRVSKTGLLRPWPMAS